MRVQVQVHWMKRSLDILFRFIIVIEDRLTMKWFLIYCKISVYVENWSSKESKTNVSKLCIKKERFEMIYFEYIDFFWILFKY